jgi:hypothetical protein
MIHMRRSARMLLVVGLVCLLGAALFLALRRSSTAEDVNSAPTLAISEGATAVKPTILASIPQPFPTEPPDLQAITVGDPDLEGYATVSGSPGAVAPNAAVAVINLNANNYITATADTHGAFTAELYAPPGSSLLIKYDVQGDRVRWFWELGQVQVADATVSNLNPLPGAILRVGEPTLPGDGSQQFHSVSAFLAEGGKGWAGWWRSGTLQVPSGGSGPGLPVERGGSVVLTAKVRVTSPGLSCVEPLAYDVTAHGFGWRYLFNAEGRSQPWGMWFNSYLFAPTGLPIEHEANGEHRGTNTPVSLTGLTCVTPNAFEGDLVVTLPVPADLPDGLYRPEAWLLSDVPRNTQVPIADVWYHNPERVLDLPPVRVGAPDPPRIPWTLLGDYPVNGHRSVGAREDRGQFAMPTRVLFPPHQVVIPRLDERTGEPIVYHLEPQSNWLSATERRLPPPPHLPIALPSGQLYAEVFKPDGSVDQLGPAPIVGSSVRTPTTPGGADLHEGTGHIGDLYQLRAANDGFAYSFEQYGPHVIVVEGQVEDVYGNAYPIYGIYDVMVARVLDLDPAQLPTTPYVQGNAFAPGLHVFPPVPAEVTVQVVQMPLSDPEAAYVETIYGQANRYGYFQPPAGTVIRMEAPGEFRVDISAVYEDPDGTLWAGYMTWGNVVEGTDTAIVAHGRRGMDYSSETIDELMPIWFENRDLLGTNRFGIENYYPYFSGDVHWGDETADIPQKGDSIHSIITLEDKGGIDGPLYNLLRAQFPKARNCYRWPPTGCTAQGLEERIEIGEAPLFITTDSGRDPEVFPDEIDLWGYWYGSSERPDVRVREILSEDGMGTAYWRFNDTYAYQIGEPADGDQPGDIKWEFGGIVLRVPGTELREYAVYSSLWVLLPHGDEVGARVTAPFRGANGTTIDGGPILTMTVEGQVQEIDMLFLPKCVRPGDVLEVSDAVAFCGHVGPPLDSEVSVTFTSPSGARIPAVLRANKIGWVYDPGFDFEAYEAGRWTVDVQVVHDRPLAYAAAPTDHHTGTVMGTTGRYAFYVVEPDAPRLAVTSPRPGFLTWPEGHVEPIHIRGFAPPGTTAVHYTFHDKGVVMGQGSVVPDANGTFTVIYDPVALHEDFPMLSLTAHEGHWEGLADEVAINLLAVRGEERWANTVTLIGEEVFVGGGGWVGENEVYLPAVLRGYGSGP